MANKNPQQVYDDNQTAGQFGVSQTPFHTHNGSDSPTVSFQSLTNRSEFLNEVLPGTSAATVGNYGVVFIAPYSCIFIGATEVHSVKGTDGSAVSLQIEKLTGTQATGSGVNLLATPFDLKGTINTIQTGVLTIATQKTFALHKGDRVGLSLTGTPTSVAQVCIIIQLSY